jgi:heat shock protein HslJ
MTDGSGSLPAGHGESVLAGRKFLSTAVTEHGVPRPMAGGTRVSLDFTADGRLAAWAGCNAIIGPVDLSRGLLTVLTWAKTQKGGPADRLAQDQWLASLIDARPSWQLSGPHLRVTTGQTVIELTDRRVIDPDRPLEHTRWVATGMIGANTLIRGVTYDTVRRTFLVFRRGRVTGSDGCQPLSCPAAVSGATIDFGAGPARSTCRNLAASELARAVRATLHGTIRYDIQAHRLILQGARADRAGAGLWLEASPARTASLTAPASSARPTSPATVTAARSSRSLRMRLHRLVTGMFSDVRKPTQIPARATLDFAAVIHMIVRQPRQ